jgi:hypothetical protein
MNAQTDYTARSSTTTWWRWGTPPRSGMRRLIAPWEYRHLRAFARVHIAAGIVLVGLGLVTLIGGSLTAKAVGFAALFLVAAAGNFTCAAWLLAIDRCAAAEPESGHRAALAEVVG